MAALYVWCEECNDFFEVMQTVADRITKDGMHKLHAPEKFTILGDNEYKILIEFVKSHPDYKEYKVAKSIVEDFEKRHALLRVR